MAALDSPAPAGARQTLALRSRRGSLTLALLCAVQFLDVADSAIVNVALPSIRRGLGFSQQDLQWVPAGYLLTYGGFLLLGGRLADLYGRRRMLSIGTAVFAAASLAAGAAGAPGTLVTARLVQGLGAALMAPAALAQLTVSFRQSGDRNVALGVWGAVSGMAAAAGVFLGGVFADGPGWRWVFLVNPPLGLAILLAAARLLAADRPARAGRSFDWQGAVLGTGALLAVVYGLVRAPIIGWWSGQTLAALAGAGLLAAWFLRTERRTPEPLVPLAILRVPGLVAADLTQLIAFTGFIGMFFFATLYMQLTLGWSPLQAGAAYLPVTAGFATAGAITAQLITRIGTRPVAFAGCLIAATGIGWLSRVPAHGTYTHDVLPGFVVMALGAGAVFVSVTAAANAGVPGEQAGLAAGLLNSSQQLGSALGLAILSAVATTRTDHLLAGGAAPGPATAAGFHRALLTAAALMAAAAASAASTANTRAAPPVVMVNTAPRRR
jgi:EmrB/QacA subfamily drug resistance transporter